MKIAIFVAGPPRYVIPVKRRLISILEGKVEFSFFYFLWKDDLGNKKRDNVNTYFLENLEACQYTKTLIINAPYSSDDVSRIIDDAHEGHSSINNVLGMFVSNSVLCSSLNQLPDCDDYTHIFRVRTDCVIINERIIEKLKEHSENINVANNPYIPKSWVSDHIMFSPREKFISIWGFENVRDVVSQFNRANRNPEKLIALRIKDNNHKPSRAINRFIDYHILYNPPKENEPGYKEGKSYTSKEVEMIFNDPYSMLSKIELEKHFNYWDVKKKYDPTNSVVKLIKQSSVASIFRRYLKK